MARLNGSVLGGEFTADSEVYWNWSSWLLAHHFASSRAFFLGPLYPYSVAALRWLFNLSSGQILLFQAIVAAVSIGLLTDAVRRQAGDAPGILVGLGLAFYRMSVLLDGLILMESLLFSLSCLLIWFLSFSRKPLAAFQLLILGALIGLLADGRGSTAVLLLPGSVCFALWPYRSFPAAALRLASVCVGFLCMTAPLALHNYRVTHEFIPLTYNGGFNLWVGNNPAANGTFVTITGGQGPSNSDGNGPDGGSEIDSRDFLRKTAGLDLSPAQSSQYWVRRSLTEIRQHPYRALRLSILKAAMLFNRVEYHQIEHLAEYEREAGPLGLPVIGDFLAMGAIGIAGLWFAVRRGAVGLFVALSGVCLAISVVPFFVTDRYRFQLVPFLAVAAGYWLKEIQSRAMTRRSLLLPLMLAGLALTITSLPLPALSDQRVQWGMAADLGDRWLRRGVPSKASQEFARAIKIEHDAGLARDTTQDNRNERAGVYFGYGTAMIQLGRTSEALPWLQQAVHDAPDNAAAVRALADAYSLLGERDKADSILSGLSSLVGGNLEVLLSTGYREAREGRLGDAERTFMRACRASPGSGAAWGALIRVQIQAGDPASASRSLEQARASAFSPETAAGYRALIQAIEGDSKGAAESLARVSDAALSRDPDLAQVVALARQRIASTPR